MLMLVAFLTPSFSFAEKKIVEYKIMEDWGNLKELESKINDMIKAGWQPLGCVGYNNSGSFVQPMVKYESEEKGNK